MVRESLTEKVIFKKRPEGKQSPNNGASGQEVASAKILGQAGAKVLEEQKGGQGHGGYGGEEDKVKEGSGPQASQTL